MKEEDYKAAEKAYEEAEKAIRIAQLEAAKLFEKMKAIGLFLDNKSK